ncbi:NAD(P)H-dependent oxidoreductase [Sphingobacterium sp. lm-10]|uniref:NADPH-dependent FMN reductase n=1 Tax=Sphingobacterium sp. lm-10 TaxID=2944904 RepID=UPI00202276FA|nr:NAD(P)H-dependent oxidoreductase [Sphingobacterium sp. lm-10]MCL7986903.1 NAD(P)H-dependent oxidoreductase [Sphingobacterium sp. lm-10]
MGVKNIGIVVGSLRKGSFNKAIGQYLKDQAPEGVTLEAVEIGNLSLYNQDYDESGEPAEYGPFREKIKAFDGIIFITPEYNRSVPGVLKNAIDVASRPYGHSAWDGKPALVISSSISNQSGFGANHHLRQSLAYLNMPTLAQPEVYIANVQNIFDEDGALKNEESGKFLKDVLAAYLDFANKHV